MLKREESSVSLKQKNIRVTHNGSAIKVILRLLPISESDYHKVLESWSARVLRIQIPGVVGSWSFGISKIRVSGTLKLSQCFGVSVSYPLGFSGS